ncbi:DUF262 domain-containing protein [Aequorivita viscosa]|nr:DUF262 domain-containing protein [Aequorivita viscosa]
MKELIFSIEDIFNNHNQNGCLTQYECDLYHIPAYQRGFKWASTKNGAVSILLNDLWNAFLGFENQDKKEYYLQYITVKKIIVENKKCLEVIDGQQRLTTLSILLAVLAIKLDKENISIHKLDYAIRDNFFNDYVYQDQALGQMLNTTWEDISKNEELNKQDLFYMFDALQKCDSFFKSKKQLESFYNYLISNVKIIVNSVENHIESETVFKNLNSNKVPLTEAELIKGLLITKIGRQHSSNFKEVTEIRSNVGKHWDELATWANKEEIKSFYFNNKQDAMQELLKLIAFCLENDKITISKSANPKDFPLFNFLLEHNNYIYTFNKLKAIKNTLDDWYHNTEIYNLLGYSRFAKNSGKNNLDFLKELLKQETKSETIFFLKKEKESLLKDLDLSGLTYSETPDSLHHILLALNVFIEGQDKIRFNFYEFEQQKWSLEHIFPQTPEGKKNVLKEEHKDAIKNILGDELSEEVENVLALDKRTDEEKQIYYKALQEHAALNGIGNMCLLSGSDNASNGNKFFNEKRDNILKRIQIGSFVPKHTFDVFSKMFANANTEQMNLWSIKDIEAHNQHIKSTLGLKETNNNPINIIE